MLLISLEIETKNINKMIFMNFFPKPSMTNYWIRESEKTRKKTNRTVDGNKRYVSKPQVLSSGIKRERN